MLKAGIGKLVLGIKTIASASGGATVPANAFVDENGTTTYTDEDGTVLTDEA